MVRAAALVLVAGCSFSGPAAPASGGDGDIADGGTADATATDGPVELGPFGTPRRLTEIEAALFGDDISDEYDDPSLSDSGELLFAAGDGNGTTVGGADVYRAQLEPGTMTFVDIERVDELSTAGFDTTPFIAANGLTALVSVGGDLFMASRIAVGGTWGSLDPVPEASNNLINSNSVEAYGQLSPDHRRLYFTSNRDGDFDLWVATLDSSSEYDNPTKLSVSAVGRDESIPRLSADELTLYFSAINGAAVEDIFVATRDAVDQPFGQAVPLAELNTGSRDVDLAVSSDHRTGVFASDREGPGSFRLYITTR